MVYDRDLTHYLKNGFAFGRQDIDKVRGVIHGIPKITVSLSPSPPVHVRMASTGLVSVSPSPSYSPKHILNYIPYELALNNNMLDPA